jgi:hypothetical protein
MPRSVSIIDYKVQQADFFLQKLEACGPEFFAAQCYADAFVSACRSITFSVQAVCKEVSGFESWYAEEQNRMKTNRLCVFFNNYRTASIHVGETPVLAGAGKQGEFHFFFMPTQDIPDVPESDVLHACHAYFKSIIDLVFRLYTRFPTDLDDRWHYTKQHFESRGLAVEDAEEAFGYPRGWTRLNGSEDELIDRWRILRKLHTSGPPFRTSSRSISTRLLKVRTKENHERRPKH